MIGNPDDKIFLVGGKRGRNERVGNAGKSKNTLFTAFGIDEIRGTLKKIGIKKTKNMFDRIKTGVGWVKNEICSSKHFNSLIEMIEILFSAI